MNRRDSLEYNNLSFAKKKTKKQIHDVGIVHIDKNSRI